MEEKDREIMAVVTVYKVIKYVVEFDEDDVRCMLEDLESNMPYDDVPDDLYEQWANEAIADDVAGFTPGATVYLDEIVSTDSIVVDRYD